MFQFLLRFTHFFAKTPEKTLKASHFWKNGRPWEFFTPIFDPLPKNSIGRPHPRDALSFRSPTKNLKGLWGKFLRRIYPRALSSFLTEKICHLGPKNPLLPPPSVGRLAGTVTEFPCENLSSGQDLCTKTFCKNADLWRPTPEKILAQASGLHAMSRAWSPQSLPKRRPSRTTSF